MRLDHYWATGREHRRRVTSGHREREVKIRATKDPYDAQGDLHSAQVRQWAHWRVTGVVDGGGKEGTIGDNVGKEAQLKTRSTERSEEHTSELQSRQYLVC